MSVWVLGEEGEREDLDLRCRTHTRLVIQKNTVVYRMVWYHQWYRTTSMLALGAIAVFRLQPEQIRLHNKESIV